MSLGFFIACDLMPPAHFRPEVEQECLGSGNHDTRAIYIAQTYPHQRYRVTAKEQ